MNRIPFFLFFLFLMLFNAGESYAQFYSSGSDPAGLKWMEIKTKRYNIIYPLEVDSLARRYAFLLEKTADAVNRPLRAKPRRLPVVLHPYNVLSNGLVTWAPRRMELITNPPSTGSYSQNWEKQLVLHESRHVAQMTMFEQGIFKPAMWLLGEQAPGLGAGLYINKWALEGDAVASETELSFSGRGRDPGHLIYFKAAFLEGDFRNRQRWAFGSYRQYTPDDYSLGYLLHSTIRFRTGNYHFMGDLTRTLVKNWINPSGSSVSFRKSSGMNLDRNIRETTKLMTSYWRREDSLRAPFTQLESVTYRTSDYVTYKSVIPVSSDSVYAVKSDLNEARCLVRIDESGRDVTLTFVGNMGSEPVYSRGKIYWNELIPSLRWEHESFSDIIEFDLATGSTKRLTRHQNYSNPAFTPDGDTLFVVEYHRAGGSSLVLMERANLMKKVSYPAPDKGQIRESISVGGKIYSTVITEKGMGIYRLDPIAAEWEKVVQEQHQNIERLSVMGNAMIFSSDLEGTNDIYHFVPESGQLRRLTTSKLSAVSPYYCDREKSLFFSDYTKSGYQLVKVKADELDWKLADFSRPHKYVFADNLSLQAGFNIDTVKVEGLYKFESKPYNKGRHLFRFHSWTPMYINIDNLRNITYDNFYDAVSLGATLYSQNSLGTATTMLGYSYHNKFHAGHLKFTYRGLFPVFEFKIDVNDRDKQRIFLVSGDLFNPQMVTDTVTGSPFVSASMLAYVPMNLSSGGWSRGLIPRLSWRYSNDAFFSFREGRYQDYQHITLGVQYFQVQRMTKRNIFPKWGYGANIQYNMMPFAGENFGSTLYANGYGYMPGLLKNHGIKVSAAFQKQFYDGKRYLMRNIAPSPRGYSQHFSITYASVFTDYAFPVYLGDLTLSRYLYLKRAQIIPFFDWAYSQGMNDFRHMYSYGSDFLIDFNIFNISLPLTAGVRYIRTGENRDAFQLVFQTPLL